MELVRGLHNLRAHHRGCAVTIGTFDGVHLGHRAMLERLRVHAQRLRLPATVLTFEPSPREYLDPEHAPARLSRLREKLALLATAGADRCVVLRFDERLQRMRGVQFIDELLQASLGARLVLVGHDFRFAQGGEADVGMLRAAVPEHGYELEVFPPVTIDGRRVSSSEVRTALQAGDLEHARRLLGRRYSMRGRVIEGEKLGRKLGFPTANLRLHRRRAPLDGVFAVQVQGIVAQALPGVASLGTRPTVNGVEPLLEAHVFDYEGDLYGRELEVVFVSRLRAERKFATLEALVEQMREDAREARAKLGLS